ncbi:MAG: polysaccharide biosynthesis tyrosine autokinase [Oxalobacteraceae bacterium]|nr:polysaccharide biosynthesis tyrosine autokinase [Oxalobacteraceae bacterium]
MTNQLIPQPALAPVQQPVPASMQDDDEIEFATYFNILFEHRWLIIKIAMAVTLLGVAYAFIAKPLYEANMLIHVEEEIGRSESKNVLGEMAALFEVKTAATSEMELLRSRLVVSHAVDNLRLYIDARPKYLPIFGSLFASHNEQLSTPGLFGYGGYVWGTEKIDVPIFNVPDAMLNRNFVITAESNGQFKLSDSKQNTDWKGRVGTTLNFETDKGNIQLRVEQLKAKPGAQFLLRRISRLTTINNVQKAMTLTEQGKESGIIEVTLEGRDPKIVNLTLSEIGREYMRQNGARKTEEAEKSLAFLNAQLPVLKQQLQVSEAKYNQFRNAHGTIDLGEEAKLSLQQSAAAKTRRLELQQRKAELLAQFTEAHPIVLGINSQIREMNEEIKTVAGHIKQLPMLEQEVLSLNRDIKVNTDLYTALLNTAQQLRLITAGKVSNVRLVDASMMPEKPVRPNRPLIVALAGLLGLFLGVVSAFIKKSLYGGIDDPDEIEKMLGVPVYATIPHSKELKELYEKISSKSKVLPLLANISSADSAIESLRTFRTALQFSMSNSKNNIVLITGATPGLGKTFVSANLAAIIATTGKRVLLIDADLRNGHLHQYFGLSRQDGLSNAISGKIPLEQVIHRGVIEHMDFISAGGLPANPSELLLHQNVGEMLQLLSARYDLILIDTTPILAVSDTLIIGAHAGAIYIVTRAGVTTASEIQESMKRLRQAGLAAKGVLFNDIKQRTGRYKYSYANYRNDQNAPREKTLIETSP